MSLAVLRSRALAGMEALCVRVEVHLANGLPGLIIAGTIAPTNQPAK
jgi:magnesium chelatase family protein